MRTAFIATEKYRTNSGRTSALVMNGSYFSGDGNDMNPALPDTSMKLGRYVYKPGLFEIFSLANQNYSNFQDGGSKFQDGCQNKY